MANSFKNSLLRNVGTSPETVYTAGTGVQATVIGMSVANTRDVNIRANVYLVSAATDYFIVKQATIEPGSALIPVGGDQKLVLESGDFLRVQSDLSQSLDVIVSVLEVS
jgi:hypothetical protein